MTLTITKKLTSLFIFIISMGFSISLFAQPANNECSGATDISSLFGQTSGAAQTSMLFDNTGATSEASDPTTGWECFGEPNFDISVPIVENSTWYTFTGDGNLYYITTTACNSSNYLAAGDTQIAVYDGACGTLNPVGCNEDGQDATDTEFPAGINIQTTAGTVYYMMIDGFNFEGSLSSGEFCIQVTQETTESCMTAAGTTILANGGVATGEPIVCFEETTVFTLTGASIPTETEAGFFWAVSTGDLTGTTDPTADPSYLGAFGTTATTYLPAFVNDGSQLPAGQYYFTAISYGGAGVDSTGSISFAGACVFTANSVPVTLVEELNDMMLTSSIIDNTGANDGEIRVDVTGGSGTYNYDWGNGINTGSISGLTGGDYTVTISDLTGCVDDIVETFTVNGPQTGVEELEALASIEFFPNPANDFATISYQFNQNHDLSIRIMDIVGRTVIEQAEGVVKTGKVTLDLRDLKKGIYLIQFSSGEDIITRKLFVDRP